MRSIRRALISSLLLVAAVSPTFAQLKAPFNQADPFTISTGRTFSASGGGGSAAVVPDAILAERTSRISDELREAQAIIARGYIDRERAAPADLLKNGLDGMLKSLDPHSNFYDAAEWKDMMEEQRSTYSGIGATISNYEIAGVAETYIIGTFPGSAAARAQVRYGEKIIAINGERMSGKTSDLVRDKLRGPNGSPVRVTFERVATRRIETIEIRRGRVPQPSIPDYYILRPTVGYIELSDGFNYTTYEEFDTALAELKRQGMKSLILDLRGNGGGIVDQAVKVAERFLPAGSLILTQRGRGRLDNRMWQSSNNQPEQMPLVVLVDGGTASASEIVAGAFQDDDRALIVGKKTFGKGLVQSVIDLPGKAGLTLTTARYLTPSGRSIQRDYSKIPLYDYYQHKQAAADIDRPYFEARTITNRRVFGGDGISPDEIVDRPDLTPFEASLLDPIFHFTRELLAARIGSAGGYRIASPSYGKRVAASDFPVTDELLQAFEKYASSSLFDNLDNRSLRAERNFIKTRIRYQLVLAAYGVLSANRVLIEDDPQAAKAVESLPGAARLATLASKRRENIR